MSAPGGLTMILQLLSWYGFSVTRKHFDVRSYSVRLCAGVVALTLVWGTSAAVRSFSRSLP